MLSGFCSSYSLFDKLIQRQGNSSANRFCLNRNKPFITWPLGCFANLLYSGTSCLHVITSIWIHSDIYAVILLYTKINCNPLLSILHSKMFNANVHWHFIYIMSKYNNCIIIIHCYFYHQMHLPLSPHSANCSMCMQILC